MEYIALTRDLIYGQQRFGLITEDNTILFPTGYWDYGTIVDTLIKERYPSDRMEAVTNNHLANQADMESAQAYTEMLRYRGECKVLARELMRYSVDHGLALPEFVEAFEPTENTRLMVLQKIQNYNMSDNVDGFILGGQQVWLTKPQRESLLTSLNMFVKAGVDTFPFVLGGRAMELPCAQMEQMLAAVEVYATQCMMVTAGHTAAVTALVNEEEMLAYDFTEGYPEMLHFNV
jgi:hypothetical protein